MYSISYSAVCLRHVNRWTSSHWGSHHEMISMPPPINRGYHDCGWSNAGLRRSQFLQTILRGGLSSRQQSGSHCQCPAAPLPWPPENENTFENGAAFQVNLRVVEYRRLLCRSNYLLCRFPSKESVSWKRQLKSICLHRNRSNIYSS